MTTIANSGQVSQLSCRFAVLILNAFCTKPSGRPDIQSVATHLPHRATKRSNLPTQTHPPMVTTCSNDGPWERICQDGSSDRWPTRLICYSMPLTRLRVCRGCRGNSFISGRIDPIPSVRIQVAHKMGGQGGHTKTARMRGDGRARRYEQAPHGPFLTTERVRE